ncbi:hypothetical protein [Stutzerimonas frequens]|uniref:hypothetical protein n=1 Tax=Stutzerimonas frequens TaxID=2968969 RepID=UPI001AAF2826|nr:hypothetical protein [Stutzerimonas frequens]QTF59085.1 hypothetical protein J4H94_20945 [Stutzerimonas frequens]
MLTLRACSRLSAGGGAGLAGAAVELLQAFALPRARSWILGVLDVDQVLLQIGAACGADLAVELLQARWPSPGAGGARVLEAVRRRRYLPGRGGEVLDLLQAFARVRCWIQGAIEVDQVLLLLIGAGGADVVVELLQARWPSPGAGGACELEAVRRRRCRPGQRGGGAAASLPPLLGAVLDPRSARRRPGAVNRRRRRGSCIS